MLQHARVRSEVPRVRWRVVDAAAPKAELPPTRPAQHPYRCSHTLPSTPFTGGSHHRICAALADLTGQGPRTWSCRQRGRQGWLALRPFTCGRAAAHAYESRYLFPTQSLPRASAYPLS